MGHEVNLREYQGPLDLLLQLIGTAKIDIRDIFVSEVTEQYIRLVEEAGMLDMEEASELNQMAATLLLIKCRSMLPAENEPKDEEDPEEALIRQLEEYARFQQIAAQMKDFELAAAKLFTKLPEEFPLPPQTYELEDLTLQGLIDAFAIVSARILDEKDTGHEKPGLIYLDERSVSRCMSFILRATRKGSLGFTGLLSQHPTRNEVVTLFLALLELIKQGRLSVSQGEAAKEMMVSRTGSRGSKHAR
jgi:segregation and condensation protein A